MIIGGYTPPLSGAGPPIGDDEVGCPTLADFGAVPNTNVSGALQAALNFARDNQMYVCGTGDHYLLNTPVTLTLGANINRPWGFMGHGDTFVNNASPPQPTTPAIRINCNSNARFLYMQDFCIRGQSMSGLKIGSTSGNLHNVSFKNIVVDDVSSHAFMFENNIFEMSLYGCMAHDCKTGAGFHFSNPGSGIVSAVYLIGCMSTLNNVGVHLLSPVRHVVCIGCYIRDSRQEGAIFGNGMDSPWISTNFENNWKTVAPGSSTSTAHVVAPNNGLFIGCNWHDFTGGCFFAVNLSTPINLSVLSQCVRTSSGISPTPKAINIGAGTGRVSLVDCKRMTSPTFITRSGSHSGILDEIRGVVS